MKFIRSIFNKFQNIHSAFLRPIVIFQIKRYLPYILSFGSFMLIIFLVWRLLIVNEIISEYDKKITATIGILGLSFGMFQFCIREINYKRRQLFTLRYEAYNEIMRLIGSISDLINGEILNTESIQDEPLNSNLLLASLINKTNQISSIINSNNDYLFPGIIDFPTSKMIEENLSKLVEHSGKLRNEILKKTNEEHEEARFFFIF